ncbi:MAG: site-specific integrase [Nitriliruptor sp.]|nr:MAG: site-specific integrase [Nitriliruptor sp.]
MSGTLDKYRVSTKHPDTGRYERWRIRWDLPPDPYTGERRRGSEAGFATRKAAETALTTILGQVQSGTYVTPSHQRLGVYLTGWLAGLRLKPTALDNYRTSVEVHIIPRLGGVALSDLTAEQVDGLYRELERHGKRAGRCRTSGVTCKANGCAPDRHHGLAPKSVRHVHTALRKALQDAVGRGYLGRNVADLANPPTQRSARGRRARDKSWNLEQLRTFLEATQGARLGPAWQLTSTTGLRRGELCGLRWADVDLDRGRLRVAQTVTEVRGELVTQDNGKTDAAERSIALDGRTVEVLRGWKRRQTEDRLAWPGDWPDTGLVFTREDGEGHRPKRISSGFTAAVDRLGLPRIGVHGLRHSYATAALRAGVSPEVVSKRLGHASVVITLSIYAHVFEQDDEAAAELAAEAIYGP